MYCVIQELERKKPDKHGGHKELITDSFKFTIGSAAKTKYTWRYSEERFERPIKKAFKISIHASRRVKGVVTTKANAVTTAITAGVMKASLA